MKLGYIDTLRGLAILAVIIVHCSINGNNELLPSVFRSVVYSGVHGVQLFYVASAFTMFLTLHNRERTEEYRWQKFFIRRFFRIAPMYYVGICYFLWQDGFGQRYWLGDADHVTHSNILANFLFVHGFNPYWITSVVPGGWSIADEMLFYCLIPVLFLKIKNTQQAFWLVIASLGLRLLLDVTFGNLPIISSERLWQEYLYLYLPSQFPVFALGILFFYIVKDGYRISISPTLVLVTAAILTAQFIGVPMGLPVLPNHFLFSSAFVVLCIALSRHEFKALVNPVFIYLGKISFSMYLVHFAVIHWLIEFDAADYMAVSSPYQAVINYCGRLVVVTGLTIMISSVFYMLVEQPMQVLGKRVIDRLFQCGVTLAPEGMAESKSAERANA